MGLALSARPVGADATWTVAGTCQWDEVESFDANFDGEVENNATSGIEHRLSCGLATPGYASASSTDGLYVYYYDGNNGTAMEDHVYCNIYSCNMSGSTWATTA